ncbi:MAG: hypothetical protein U0Q11_04275 [Vicinamibacterales bacterium]
MSEADLVLHVIDASTADRERRMAAVHRVLEEVGLPMCRWSMSTTSVASRQTNGTGWRDQRRKRVYLGA